MILPDEWKKLGYHIRHETADDIPFLRRLFETVRQADFAELQWPDAIKQEFFDSQFLFQRSHRQQAYAGADRLIVMQGATSIGNLCLWEGSEEMRLVDISLLPDWRGRGLGTALLKALQKHAAHRNYTVNLSVREDNPARQLYRKLGFIETRSEGPDLLMRWIGA